VTVTLFRFLAPIVAFTLTVHAQHVLLEAEQFAQTGGWVVDQQFMDQMGSPFLLAHGLGVPVRDAVTTAKFPSPGKYRVWVRTRDWVALWKASGAPGRFQVLVNGKPLAVTFGTEGAEWHWQDGGIVEVGKEAKIALHDLTGFEGRCDAILFSRDLTFTPPNESRALRLSAQPEDGGAFDFLVVGGGIAGCCAAVSAARQGLTVALVQDRPVLGGNGSSEVRVWPEGKTQVQPFPHIGDIVEEICPPITNRPPSREAGSATVYEDDRKLAVVRAEPRITLLLEHRVNAVEMRGKRIVAVIAQNTHTARPLKLSGKLFADCTGDGAVGFLAGADYEISTHEHQGITNPWSLLECSRTVSFPRLSWAVDLSDKPFPGRWGRKGQWADTPLSNLGGWFWESGFDKDPINDLERIRDLNFRAMYGAWDALKNVDKLYPNHRLAWAAFIAGKRESRRLLGDVILTGDDFRKQRTFPDPAFPCSWHIDVHSPHPEFSSEFKGEEFISQATVGKEYRYKSPYWAPYRTLYSRNIENLFMAGRDISVTREALGPVRVMRTCGMMGEIVGKAAWIAVRHDTTPRGVYEQHVALLHELMRHPGAHRRKGIHNKLQ